MRTLARLCAFALGLLLASEASAGPEVFVAGGDSLDLWVLVQWDRPLPRFVEERLERGIPATVGLRVELWQDRSAWPDRRLAQIEHEIQVARDSWTGVFLRIEEGASATFDSLGGLRSSLSRHRLQLPLEPLWCDGSTSYRTEVTAYVLPLSVEDADEVESWLKGQIRGLGRGLLGIPKGLFGVIRDLSGLGERTSKGTSARFRLETVSGGRVRVLIPPTGQASLSGARAAVQ